MPDPINPHPSTPTVLIGMCPSARHHRGPSGHGGTILYGSYLCVLSVLRGGAFVCESGSQCNRLFHGCPGLRQFPSCRVRTPPHPSRPFRPPTLPAATPGTPTSAPP